MGALIAKLLAGIGIKDYLYGAAILAIIGGFAYFIHHERVIGADEALAPVAVLANKAQVQVAVGGAVAQSTETANAKQFDEATAAPVPVDLGLVCHSDASGSAVPEAGTGTEAAAGEPAPVGGSSAAFDPSGAVLEVGRAADAQIAYLQGRVLELENQMKASP